MDKEGEVEKEYEDVEEALGVRPGVEGIVEGMRIVRPDSWVIGSDMMEDVNDFYPNRGRELFRCSSEDRGIVWDSWMVSS